MIRFKVLHNILGRNSALFSISPSQWPAYFEILDKPKTKPKKHMSKPHSLATRAHPANVITPPVDHGKRRKEILLNIFFLILAGVFFFVAFYVLPTK